jgi:hypothetical protein
MLIVLVLIVGVFIGAFAVELMNLSPPPTVARARRRAGQVADEVRRGFYEGYRDASEGRRGASRRSRLS